MISPPPKPEPQQAFTLIELLVVIAIIGALAAIVFPASRIAIQKSRINQSQAQRDQIVTAIESYKAARSQYPPDNPAFPVNASAVPPLFYELTGTRFSPAAGQYISIAQGSDPVLTAAAVNTAFGVGGFVNTTRPGAGDEAVSARDFARGLSPNQHEMVQVGGINLRILVTALQGNPSGLASVPPGKQINPWHYVSTKPAYNTSSFDLWVDLLIGGKTYRICNWSKSPIPNPPTYGTP